MNGLGITMSEMRQQVPIQEFGAAGVGEAQRRKVGMQLVYFLGFFE